MSVRRSKKAAMFLSFFIAEELKAKAIVSQQTEWKVPVRWKYLAQFVFWDRSAHLHMSPSQGRSEK